MNTSITRIYIKISNKKLFDFLLKYPEIIYADRHLKKNHKRPTCEVEITQEPCEHTSTASGIKLIFDIPNVYDERWHTLFPQSLQEIIPYLRWVLKTDAVSKKAYRKFETELIEEQKDILQAYKGFYIQINELHDNGTSDDGVCSSSLYEARNVFQLRNGNILRCVSKTEQTVNPIAESDTHLDCTNRNLFALSS